jgi:hypothetical protein
MEVIRSSEKSVATQQTTRHHIAEDDTLHNHRCGNLKSYTFTLILYYQSYQIPRRYPYFDVVVGLAWSYDHESYAGGSVADGRVSHAGQVKDDPDKKGYPGSPCWGLGVGLTAPPLKKL